MYVGALDGRLIAIDAKSGKPAWSVTTVDQKQAYTSTGAPRIAKGKVIIGNGGAEYGVRGYVSAYDAETGQLQSASFMDYAMPNVDGFLGFKTAFDTSVPCKTNRLGVKGVGELGTIGATPAVVNAVIDALDHAGLGAAAEAIQMPVTAERVWRALNLKTFDPSPFKL